MTIIDKVRRMLAETGSGPEFGLKAHLLQSISSIELQDRVLILKF